MNVSGNFDVFQHGFFFVKTRNQNRIEKHFPSFGFDFLKLTDYNSALCFTVPVNYNCQDHTQHFEENNRNLREKFLTR